MCKPTTRLTQDDIQMQKTSANFGRLSTDISSSDSSKQPNDEKEDDTNMGLFSFLKSFVLVSLMSVIILEFAQWLPFNIPLVGAAAIETYIPAWYQYDAEHTKFDNSLWTYGTDYVLTAVMSYLAIRCVREVAPDDCPEKDRKNAASLKLRLYSASLLVCYGISTLAGGWAHQHFTTLESLNTNEFRLLWIVCVGNVSFGSCYMGLIGREVQKVFGVERGVPLGTWWFWPVYGSYMAAACAIGYISFKRPACDTFIAGITQVSPTVYCILALGLRNWSSSSSRAAAAGNNAPKMESPIDLVRLPYRLMFYVGFLGNAPLLPMYPMLVQMTSMSIPQINTLLHTWLMVMWGMQGISLLHLCKAMSSYKPKVSTD